MGQIVNRRRVMGGGGVIDLSLVDNAGRARSSMTTANCYLVHKAGDYMLPLVYGNAIEGGEVYTVAFNPGGTTTDTYTAVFKNHNDDTITAPWITKSASGSGINQGMGLVASAAELLWQDAQGLITSVSISDDGDYLCFTVGSFTGGNALLCVKDINGNIMWSWHIWATEETLDDVVVIDKNDMYTVSSINLGWVATGGNGRQGYCTYYQWGRKDPFIPAIDYTTSTNHTVYDISGNTVTGISYSGGANPYMSYTIKNPTVHLQANSGTYSPYRFKYRNFWDAQNTSTGANSNETQKTVYDPCPPDFCVPTGYFATIVVAASASSDSTNKGHVVSLYGGSIWVPWSGRRENGSSNLVGVGTSSRYATATPNSDTSGYAISIGSNQTTEATSIYRSTGFVIRPVVEHSRGA